MKNRRKGNKTNVAILMFLLIITIIGVYYLIIVPVTKDIDTENSINEDFGGYYEDGIWSTLGMFIMGEFGELNNEICYDLYYYPDKEKAGYFVTQMYQDYYSGNTSFGESFLKNSGEKEFRVYRTLGEDKIKIIFEDGTEELFNLPKNLVITRVIDKESKFPYYDCYFFGRLIASNLSYDKLKEYSCNEYRKSC